MFVKENNKEFDHDLLYKITYHITGNLNRIIDENYYPVPEAKKSNLRHRPIGIGVQGLADTFLKMRYPFESEEAKGKKKEKEMKEIRKGKGKGKEQKGEKKTQKRQGTLKGKEREKNRKRKRETKNKTETLKKEPVRLLIILKALNVAIFETIYYASARASCDISKVEGPFPSFEGCPASKGILSPDMWGGMEIFSFFSFFIVFVSRSSYIFFSHFLIFCSSFLFFLLSFLIFFFCPFFPFLPFPFFFPVSFLSQFDFRCHFVLSLIFFLFLVKPSSRWDYEALRQDIMKHGMRNSLLVAPMPTASTSQILGNNECFEPFTSNIYTRRVLAGKKKK